MLRTPTAPWLPSPLIVSIDAPESGTNSSKKGFWLTLFTALPAVPAVPDKDGRYETPAILSAVAQSRSHVSAMPTPAPAEPSVSMRQASQAAEPSASAPQASQEIPVTEHAPGMAKYYAPVPCPPLPAQPSQSSTYTWPDSLVDVPLAPAPPMELASPHPAPPAMPVLQSEPLFFSPSPPAVTAPLPPSAPAVLAPIPVDSAVNRALSSMAMGRTLAEDLMDIEAGIPLPQLSTPLLRNPLLTNATEEELLLFSHIKPLQGAALARAAGVLLEELLPHPALVGNPEVASPLVPDTAPSQQDSAPPTQEAPFLQQPPSDTYEDTTLAQNLAHLAGLFPAASSKTFTIVLDKVDGDLPAASAWMQSVTDVHRSKGVLMGAFPDAPSEAVEKSLHHYKGDFLLVFYGLTRNYQHTKEWANFRRIRSKGVLDIDDPAPEFVYDDPATEAYEWQWWQVAVSIRSHHVASQPAAKEMWDGLAGVATAPREITPRFVDYVRCLGLRESNKSDFERAIRTLRAQPKFKVVEAQARPAIPCDLDSPRDAATIVLQVLLSDRYISPTAAAWLAIRASGSDTLYAAMAPLFSGFPKVRRKLWNDRNLHLAAWSATSMKHREHTNSPTGSKISAADTKSAYSSTVPAHKGKEIHPMFSKTARGKAPKVRVQTAAERKAAVTRAGKKKASAAALARKQAMIDAQEEAVRMGVGLEDEEEEEE